MHHICHQQLGQDISLNFSCYDVVQGCDNMIELSQVYCDGWGSVAKCASTWQNHTSGLVVQMGGNLIETEDMVVGGVAAAGRRA